MVQFNLSPITIDNRNRWKIRSLFIGPDFYSPFPSPARIQKIKQAGITPSQTWSVEPGEQEHPEKLEGLLE
jgi:hypothetical protein